MGNKNKEIILFQRLLIWILYLFSFFITFAKVIYPLSIFWLQIRIKRKGNFLPIDPTMSTSQLWFNLLPVIGSLFTVIISILNVLIYLTEKLI